MKLRIDKGSLRLRLNRPDVDQFRKTGVCTESLRFGSGAQLTYTLETSSRLKGIEAEYSPEGIRVLLPPEMAREWAASDQVSLSLNRADDGGPSLLIEKDFQCLHRNPDGRNDDSGAFPNPLARP